MPSAVDTLITGGTLVTSDGLRPATIGIRDGRIAQLAAPEAYPPAARTIEASGLHILPGIIDTHVHTRHPGVPAREDFHSGTAAAAAGGITTLIEMPIAKPSVHDARSLGDRAALCQETALVDFALYGGAGHANVDAIAEQAAAGAVGFKTFLQPPPADREDEFLGLWCTDPATLRDVMAAVARTERPHCFHCEDAAMVAGLRDRLRAAGRRDGRAHAESRPPIVEDTSVATVLAVGAEADAHVHVVHLSSPRAAQLIADARRRGQTVTAETCPHYLLLTADALVEHGPFATCNPALREADDVDRLWPYLLDGTIDVIGSDHSPFLEDEKRVGDADIFLTPPGFPGLEVLLPLMLTAVHERRLELPRLAGLMAERAATLFRLPGKGRLVEGADADLVLVDLDASWTFDPSACFSRARATMRVWEGRPMHGRVVSTLVRGTEVFRNGELLAPPGFGRFVRPPVAWA
jgi:dihydropyrimidinase/allantoinase